jgi:hypothetical protein
MGGLSNGKPDLVRAAVTHALTQFVEHMNEAIAYASAIPVENIRDRIEIAQAKGLFAGSDTALDMLMIRVQCAEEFKRVAEEHNRLLKARQEVDG